MRYARKNTFVIDDPLLLTIEQRRDTIELMAIALACSGEGLNDDRAAVRILLVRGFHYIDVALLAGQARMVAYQEIVRREMSAS